MINFDDVTGEIHKEFHYIGHNFLDHPYGILIIGVSESGRTNALFNLISHKVDFDNVYLYAKYSYAEKYQLVINKTKVWLQSILMILKSLLNTHMICMVFTKILVNTLQIKKHKTLIVFDDMIADINHISKKNINPVITELFIRGRKLNIFYVLITQSYFAVPKNIRLTSTYYFNKKITNKR